MNIATRLCEPRAGATGQPGPQASGQLAPSPLDRLVGRLLEDLACAP